jgi:hypothetical protein
MMKFALGLCLLTVVVPALNAADSVAGGKLELYPTWSALSLEVSYTGDDNGNATASYVWRKQGEERWRNGVDMTFDRERRLIWASVWPLDQRDTIEVKVALDDADGGKSELAGRATSKKLLLEPKGGRTFFVSPQGDDAGAGTEAKPFKTLGHAARQVKPGDVVLALSGVYAEAELFQRLKGTEDKPIVFMAAPNAKPILDSSISLPKGSDAWKDMGGGLFATDAEMYNGDGGGYVAQDGLRSFRYPTLADLKADKLKVGRAWHYDTRAKKLYVRTGTGLPASAHAYNLAQHAIGIHLTASSHVMVRGFTIQNFGAANVRISEGARGCVLYENEIRNAPGGIFMKSETTSDNAIWKNDIHEPGMADFSWTANYAFEYANQAIYCTKAGRGHSFCFNRIHDHFDFISVESWKNPENLQYNRDCDILFNELFNSTDDAIEVDGGGVNLRIHGNNIRNCHTAISLAPVERGPVYVTRNHASFLNLFFKFNVNGCTSHGWTYIYHNTGYCLLTGPDGGTGFSFPPTIPCSNKVVKNNVVIVNDWCVRAGKDGYTLDGNCYFNVPNKPPRRFQWDKKTFQTIADFSKATGQEKHGLYADPMLRNIPDVGKLEAPANLGEIAPSRYKVDRNFETLDLHLKDDSPCIDRGVVIRGINEDFHGKGPDMGAFER